MRNWRWTLVLLLAWGMALALQARQRDDYEIKLQRLGADPEAVEQVVAQLETLLKSDAPESKIGALDWLLRDAKTRAPQLAGLILPLCQDTNADVRVRAVRNLRWLVEDVGNSQALERLTQALTGSDKGARLEALNVLRQSAQSSSPLHRHDAIVKLLPQLIKHSDADTEVAAIGVVAANASLLKNHPEILSACFEATQSNDAGVRNAASDVLIGYLRSLDEQRAKVFEVLSKAAEKDSGLKERIAPLAPTSSPSTQGTSQPLLLTIPVNAPDLTFFAAFIQPSLTKSTEATGGKNCITCHTDPKLPTGNYRLQPPDDDARFSLQATLQNYQATLQMLNINEPMKSLLVQKVTQPHGGVGAIWADENCMERQLLTAWLNGEKLDASLRALLDFEFFVKNIQPILVAVGEDGSSCANCHNTHAVFNIKTLRPDGTWTLSDARHNYANALKVVDPDNPLNSLILKKPISPREGSPDTGVPHAGGVRWRERRDASEWKALYAWVQRRLLK